MQPLVITASDRFRNRHNYSVTGLKYVRHGVTVYQRLRRFSHIPKSAFKTYLAYKPHLLHRGSLRTLPQTTNHIIKVGKYQPLTSKSSWPDRGS